MASPPSHSGSKPPHDSTRKRLKNAAQKLFSRSRSTSRSPHRDNLSTRVRELSSSSPSPALPETHSHTSSIASHPPTPSPAIEPSGVEPSVPGGRAGVVSRSAVRMLRSTTGLFPPLQAALEPLLLLGSTDAESDRERRRVMIKDTIRMAQALQKYMHESTSKEHHIDIQRILECIEAQANRLNEYDNRTGVMRILTSSEDGDTFEMYQHQIETSFREMMQRLAFQTLEDKEAQRMAYLKQTLDPGEDAFYNSRYSTTVRRHGCTLGTREGVCANLQAWILDSNTTLIYWINGMAGTGKTTIAYSICEWLETNELLSASFFCSRGSSSCRAVQSMIPTIAYQLARRFDPFRESLFKILETSASPTMFDVVQQFDKLIAGPAYTAKDAMPARIVVVIDALDECDDRASVSLLLDKLQCQDSPIKFIVTSRPDPLISDKMLLPSAPKVRPSILHLHELERSLVEMDIKTYLTVALVNVSPTPSEDQVEQLAQKAGCLFVFAAVVARYICPENIQVDSGARLRSLLEVGPRNHKSKSSGCYCELDQFYTSILTMAFDNNLEEAEAKNRALVLRTVACVKAPIAVSALASLICLSEQQTMASIRPLESVIYLSSQEKHIYLLHPSFLDYLLDSQRSGNFYFEEAKHNFLLADRCFQVMERELCFNICRLHSSFMFDQDITNMSERIALFISPALAYACRYWGEHLQRVAITHKLCDQLDAFLSQRLLFWMEVMNVKGNIGKGAAMLLYMHNLLMTVDASDDTRKQIADAWDFVTRFASGASSRSTPHLYVSALAFVPRGSSVYANYWGRTRGLVNVSGTAVDCYQHDHIATWTADSIVNSVAFSSDGDWIASGSKDGSVSVRDAYTGTIVTGPLKSQMGSVTSVAISPDCTSVASGSSDCTIIVWSLRVGAVVSGPFEGHTYAITSVCFSPDGHCIASGSVDRTLRVWNIQGSEPMCRTFRGHTRSVNSLAFSPDGRCIASGSSDFTIRIWDAHTGGVVAGPFKEHLGPVNSIAFSPDGASVASGSSDFTVRVWDINSGTIVVGPLQGHTNRVSSIAFSPDGAYITSGSYDSTIRKWDLHTGLPTGLFKGHTRPVTSVAFSPDSTRIISGSYDHTIQLRNANAATPLPEMHKFNGHTQCITSVACSPDNASIVSSSHDLTIRRWDMQTGALLAGPFKGHERPVTSVAFSPSGSQVASGSMDCSVRVWDTVTGVPTIESLLGHAAWVNSVAFAPDGVRLISGSHDRSIKVWDIHAGCTIFTLSNAHSMPISSVILSPDGARIASGSHDGTVQVWDAQTGVSVTGPLGDYLGPITSVAYSPDGTLVASTSAHSVVRVWDIRAGNEVSMSCNGNETSVNSVAFSRSGSSIVSGWADSTTRVSDTRSGLVVSQRFQWHGLPVTSVATSPNGSYTITGYGDRTSPHTQIRVSSFCQHEESNNYFDGHWALDPDGWVTLNENVLFWSPHPIRQYLPLPYDSLVITQDGILQASYLGLTLGERWANCYNPV